MDETPEQKEELQQLYRDDPAMTQVLDAFYQYVNAMRTVGVDTIWDRVGRTHLNRSQVVAAFKKFHSMNFGIYKKGSRGYASRFDFSRSQGPLRLAILARGGVGEDDLPDDFSAENKEFKADEEDPFYLGNDNDSGLVPHKFRLRENREIVFELPGDFTFKEAKRLSLFLKSLPFDSEGEDF